MAQPSGDESVYTLLGFSRQRDLEHAAVSVPGATGIGGFAFLIFALLSLLLVAIFDVLDSSLSFLSCIVPAAYIVSVGASFAQGGIGKNGLVDGCILGGVVQRLDSYSSQL